jgi:hypothetical protein
VSSTQGTISQLTSTNAAITNNATISGTANIAIAILEITTANVITANTLTVSGNINGSGNNLSGFSNVARTGSYTDLINTPATNYEPRFDIRTADFTANVGRRYGIDTRVGTIIATLPNSGLTAGDAIFFIDAGGDFTANNFTIARNGNTINGVGSNFVANTNGDSVGVFWNGTGWRTYE